MPDSTKPRTLRDRVMKRHQALDQEWEYNRRDWEDCADFIDGARGRFFAKQHDAAAEQRRRRNDLLYNEEAKFAANTLASGMMAGVTSPARPWFALSTGDPQLDENPDVKMWLKSTQEIMLQVFGKSNFYGSMYSMYRELGVFGTACMGAYRSSESLIRFVPYTIGSFRLGVGAERRVDTMYRKYTITTAAAVGEFGLKNMSEEVRKAYNAGRDNQPVTILHAIEPNDERVFGSPLAREMPYRSAYFEYVKGKKGKEDPIRLSGFKDKPFMAPRWSVVEDEAYASSYPGIDSMGTNKGLQVEELDYAMAREKMHNPPLIGDASLRQTGIDLVAGGVSYIANMGQNNKASLQSVYDVRPDISALVEAIGTKETRINRAFYADLFLMLTDIDRAQITATEIAERKEEKLLMLGPVLERLNTELLDPVIDRTFDLLYAQGFIPPPPSVMQGLAGQDLKTEYVSVLAQAQKAVSTAAVEATAAFVGNLAATGWPEARHKMNPFEAIEDYARAKGVAPDVLRADDEAQQLAQAEAQAMQAQQVAEAAPQVAGAVNQAAQAAQTASETSLNGDPMLDQMLSGLV
jgi:hypothetical protein